MLHNTERTECPELYTLKWYLVLCSLAAPPDQSRVRQYVGELGVACLEHGSWSPGFTHGRGWSERALGSVSPANWALEEWK